MFHKLGKVAGRVRISRIFFIFFFFFLLLLFLKMISHLSQRWWLSWRKHRMKRFQRRKPPEDPKPGMGFCWCLAGSNANVPGRQRPFSGSAVCTQPGEGSASASGPWGCFHPLLFCSFRVLPCWSALKGSGLSCSPTPPLYTNASRTL